MYFTCNNNTCTTCSCNTIQLSLMRYMYSTLTVHACTVEAEFFDAIHSVHFQGFNSELESELLFFNTNYFCCDVRTYFAGSNRQ